MATDLTGVKGTHPVLYASVVRAYNTYNDWVNKTSALKDWMGQLGGMAMFDQMTDALLLHPAVQALGDQNCKGMYPLLEDAGTPQTPSVAGAKIKLVGPYSPTSYALLDQALVQVSPGSDGEPVVEIWLRDSILSAVPVKMSKLWAGAPGVQYSVREGSGRRVMAAHTCDLLSKDKQQTVQVQLTAL